MRFDVGERSWDVLLIGGASGTGKSSVSYRLARAFEVGICEIDDLHSAILHMTTPAQLPLVHYWQTHPEVSDLEPEEIVELFLSVSKAMAPAVRAVVGQHVESHVPIIIEGDYLLPETVTTSAQVKAAFLYEPDEQQLLANYAAREPSAGPQAKRARVSWLLGEWLRGECGRHGILALPARPWNTVLQRIADSIR